MENVTREVGGALLAPHINVVRIIFFFREKWNVGGGKDLVRVAEVGVAVGVREGGDLRQEISYINHHRANKHEEEVQNMAMEDVVRGKAMLFRAEDTGRIVVLHEDQDSCKPRSNIRRSNPGDLGRATVFGQRRH